MLFSIHSFFLLFSLFREPVQTSIVRVWSGVWSSLPFYFFDDHLVGEGTNTPEVRRSEGLVGELLKGSFQSLVEWVSLVRQDTKTALQDTLREPHLQHKGGDNVQDRERIRTEGGIRTDNGTEGEDQETEGED